MVTVESWNKPAKANRHYVYISLVFAPQSQNERVLNAHEGSTLASFFIKYDYILFHIKQYDK